MKKLISGLIAHPLIAGSTVVFAGSLISNVLNYLFNLVMGRLLTVSDYGLLTSLSSMTVLFGIFHASFTSIFARFSAKYRAKGDKRNFKHLLSSGLKFVIFFDIAFFTLLMLLTPLLGQFLHVNNLLLIFLIFFSVFISILYALPSGVLQGEMRFLLLSALNISGPVIKIAAGTALVFAGFSVLGATYGILLSSMIPLVIAGLIVAREHKGSRIESKGGDDFIGEFKKFSYQLFLTSLGITIISNADIILVRHFFDPVTSGHYAALSLMGKAIFYITSPIYFVFFPLIAHKKERGEKLLETLIIALGIVIACNAVLSLVYFTFPDLILKIFFPAPEYKVLASYLGPYSLYVLIFSSAYLFSNFFLSIGKTSVYKINLVAGLLFVLGVVLFHGSLFAIIANLFIISFLLLVSLLIFYLYHGRD